MQQAARVPAQVVERFADQRWRLNNLYWITDKEGRRVKFELNWAQAELLADLHYLNLILKARQLGFTTFIQIYLLDVCLFYRDTRAGVIAHTREDAEAIFRDKIKFPYDNLPDGIRAANPIKRDNTTTLELANNSLIRVGTSLRGGTLQYLHISEFGKICAKYPEKAREIVTGALNTIQAGQIAFIESTAEGQEGRYYDLCQEAQAHQRKGAPLTPLDWRFFFFPWWKEPAYAIDPAGVVIDQAMADYFAKLKGEHGIHLSLAQKAWYAKKARDQGADMKREYPSTPEEAFEASVEGAYFGEQMARAEIEGRIGSFPWQPGLEVHTVWDIGIGDYTTIWFFQAVGKEVHVVDFYHNSGEGAGHYAEKLAELARERGYQYGRHYLPHDVEHREWGSGRTRIEQLRDHGIAVFPVPKVSVDDGINAVRALLPACWFDEVRCAEGIRALKNYRKEWDDDRGVWKDRPRHDWASHGADAFRYLALVYREMKPEDAKPKTRDRWDRAFSADDDEDSWKTV